MLKNFKITIEYDGSAYHGWQRQALDRTIQGELESALAAMTGSSISVTGSGRTDAGVHALNQTANFRCATSLSPEVFLKGLNSLLPEDIVIKSCERVPDKFHARYDVKSKTYHYRILNRPLPSAISRQYAWHIREKLDLNAMRSALSCIVGRHDFKAFEGSGSPRSDSVRCIMNVDLVRTDDEYVVLKLEGDGFLKFMVRNIAGTLVDVGLGKITPDDFSQILASKDRNRAGITAPSCGLFLVEVKY
ncbi:MAG: tRNA pseudouridine(38-40) synthase TruA [Desulfobacterales bacterium]